MRLGTSSPLVYDSAAHWAEYQLELGCRTCVFPVQSSESGVKGGDLEKKIVDYRDAAAKAGITIAEVGVWRNALAKDPDERKKNIDYCVEQLRLADFVGARCCVNVAGTTGARWDGGYRENFSKEMRREIISVVREIVDRADPKNTYFTLEPMPWMVPTGPDDYLRLLDEVGRDRFAVHMDIINMISSADRYFHPEEFVDECAEKLGTGIRSCHIKDVHLNEAYTLRLEECPPGQGEFPLRYYAEKMNAIDPEMPMIVEHLKSDDEYPKYVEYLKKELTGIL